MFDRLTRGQNANALRSDSRDIHCPKANSLRSALSRPSAVAALYPLCSLRHGPISAIQMRGGLLVGSPHCQARRGWLEQYPKCLNRRG